MGKISNERLKGVLTAIGWVIIAFAVVALILFIFKSGVLR